jgi:hypothetical protein
MAPKRSGADTLKVFANWPLCIPPCREGNAVNQLVRVAIKQAQQTVLAGYRDRGAFLASHRRAEYRRHMGEIVVAYIVGDRSRRWARGRPGYYLAASRGGRATASRPGADSSSLEAARSRCQAR